MSTPNEKLPYYKISWLINKWVLCDGADGCEKVHEADLSMDKPAPTPKAPKAPLAPTPAPKSDRPRMITEGVVDLIDAFLRFKERLDSPQPAKPPKPAPAPKKKTDAIPSFDIQEIPAAMRKVNMPVGAKLMERWFAGELNYSPNNEAEEAGLNQDGKPYPPSMTDKTHVTMKWALGFARAKAQYDHLVKSLLLHWGPSPFMLPLNMRGSTAAVQQRCPRFRFT